MYSQRTKPALERMTASPAQREGNHRRKIKRSKKPTEVNAVKKSWSLLDLARENRSLRYAYYLFLCTLLPFVAIYTFVRSVYFTNKSPRRRPSLKDTKIPDPDDTSVSMSQESSEHPISSDDDDDNDERILSKNSPFQIQRRSPTGISRAVSTSGKGDSPKAMKKNGFPYSLLGGLGSGDSNQMLHTILFEDSFY